MALLTLLGAESEVEPIPWLLTAIFAAIGISLLVLGIRFRLGRTRNLAQFHSDPRYQFYGRYAGLALIPVGLTLWALGGVVSHVGSTNGAALAITIGGLLIFAGVFATWWAPSWLKPDWMISAEEADPGLLPKRQRPP